MGGVFVPGKDVGFYRFDFENFGKPDQVCTRSRYCLDGYLGWLSIDGWLKDETDV